jgi:PAS domain S-box-containing protein
MTREVVDLLPYLFSFVLSTGLGILGWSRRKTPGARGFMVACWSQALWTFGYILETTSATLNGKIFWDNFQYVPMFAAAVAALVMAYEYSRRELLQSGRIWLFLCAFPVFCLPLIILDPGGILRPTSVLLPAGAFTSLWYPYTPFFWAMILYVYALLTTTELLLVRSLRRATGYYRRQTAWLVAGASIPILAGLASAFQFLPPTHRDIAPLTFVLGNLLIAVGLFRYGLFDLVPIARDMLVEQIDTAVIVLDSLGRVVDFNRYAHPAFGLQQSDLGTEVAAMPAQWARIVSRMAPDTKSSETFEEEVDGSRSFFVLTCTPFHGERGGPLGRIVTIHNITDQMQTQRQLSERTRQAEDASRELESFAYAVSHDLRAPLRSIRGFSQILLKDYPDKFTGDAQVLLKHVIEAASEMNERIESLLALSRQTRTDMVPRPVSLSEIAKEVARRLQETDPARLVTWRIEDGLSATADPSLMRTALENLLGNAWKYTGPNNHPLIEFGKLPPSSEAALPQTETEKAEALTYFVRDNGVGFDMRNADDLFVPFRRLHSPKEFSGEGIGLATVQRIIHRHNGRIWAVSEPDKGAVFYFTLS